MDTTHPNGIAPVNAGTYKLGAKGGRMARAWQHIWDQLSKTDFKGGLELVEDAALKFNLKKVSVSGMLCRMRAAGVIEQDIIAAPTDYVRTQNVTRYAAGSNFDAEIELSDRQRDKGLEPLVAAIRSAIEAKLGQSDAFDCEAFVHEFSNAHEVTIRDVKSLLNLLCQASILRKLESREDRLYTASRPRVHYRIAKREQGRWEQGR